MPVEMTYKAEGPYVLIRFIGAPAMTELQDMMHALTHSDRHPPDIDTILDFRQIDMTAVTGDAERQVNRIRSRFPQRGQARLAMVVETDEGYGMARMFALLSDELPQSMSVFRSMGEAERWLAECREAEDADGGPRTHPMGQS